MSDAPANEDQAVSTILDYIALAFMFCLVEALMSREPWVAVGALVTAVMVHVVGVKWPKIKLRTPPHYTFWLDRVASDHRYRRALILLLLSCGVMYEMAYVHSLRNDLNTYGMPRTVTEKQSAVLRRCLSHHQPYVATVKVSSLDAEAREYAGQVSNALKRSGWDVTSGNPNEEPRPLNDGLCIGVTGSNAGPPDPKRDPQPLLRQALQAAHIDANCGSSVGAGEYKLFLLVGHRPLKVRKEAPMFFKLNHWIERLVHK